jgi:hypothetical protein
LTTFYCWHYFLPFQNFYSLARAHFNARKVLVTGDTVIYLLLEFIGAPLSFAILQHKGCCQSEALIEAVDNGDYQKRVRTGTQRSVLSTAHEITQKRSSFTWWRGEKFALQGSLEGEAQVIVHCACLESCKLNFGVKGAHGRLWND